MDYQKKYKAKLIVDGVNSMKEIINCINDAQHTIRIRMFMWRDDNSGRKIIEELQNKIISNPQIKIFIEKDSFGSLVYNIQKWVTFGSLGGDIFASNYGLGFITNNKNVEFSLVGSKSVLFFKYLKENDHSKVLLFDEFMPGSRVLIGGMNISDEYLIAQNHELPNSGGRHDYMVKIEGRIADNFASYGGKYSKKWLTKKILEGVEVIMSIKNKHSIRKEILKELSRAKKSVIIEHGYITDFSIIKKLRKISSKGVNIKIILPNYSDGVWHANIHSIYKILKPSAIANNRINNIEVFLYKGMIHAKVMVIDEKVAIIGSANLTYGSFDILNETNAIFRQKDGVVKELLIQLDTDIKNCEKITLNNIPKYNKWFAKFQKIFI
ncbi:MAG: phosphatidylserine/phosphatidylglycerophosphate/cardiolipin synthase family protein [Candidatus Gracilibacteria bacterium]|nr:phosphatidylserine/phosphatidylglycerophosphate/cardiolipin synthase family protein [Candidatus Gracilibacteria bacterium]